LNLETWFGVVANEVYINFGRNARCNILDQNRYYGGIAYQSNSVCNIQVGYLNQRIVKSDGIRIENNHTAQLAFIYILGFRKKSEVNHECW
jgi:hypothetical protein